VTNRPFVRSGQARRAAEVPAPGPVAAAVSLRAALDDVVVLTDAERALLAEWLDKVASPREQKASP
jgi:hypothetical protein